MINTYISKAVQVAPVLFVQNEIILKVYRMALHNLLEISTVDCPPETYNRTGLWEAEPGLMIRAGGGYPTPWTRDAAVNTMNAACFLEPKVAKNTLWAVCERVDGKLCFQMDNQSWDKIVWATGAWNYYLATGDKAFLEDAYETVKYSLSLLEKTQFHEGFGLFTGGSFFNDGITGYPADLHEKGNESSFVGDHPDVAHIMTLSTNCLYYNAYQILAKMERILEKFEPENGWTEKSERLKSAINQHLWSEEKGRYGYFVYPNGQRDDSQEGCGISFAILFGICDKNRAEKMLSRLEISRHGLVSIWPPFEGISSVEKPLRHNNLIWPFVNGFFAEAAAKCGRADLLWNELSNIAEMVKESSGFCEIYNPADGKPDGGWQCGGHWDSVADQTWSATGFIRMLVYGMFGMVMQEDGIEFHPCFVKELGEVELKGLRVRDIQLDLRLCGNDEKGARIVINGECTNRLIYGQSEVYCVEMWG